MLLPFQGELLYMRLPRALPWARGFWAFSPITSCTFVRLQAVLQPDYKLYFCSN